MMTFAAFQQLDMNKEIINIFSLGIILILGSASLFGITKLVSEPFVAPKFPEKINLYESLLYFFFILAGQGSIIKFSEESVNEKDINSSTYISLAISILLVGGLCLAAVTYIRDFRTINVDNIVGDIFEKIFNKSVGKVVSYFAILCMYISTFLGFLATIRYTYSLLDKDSGNGRVSQTSILIIALLCLLAILINQTSSLVELSDVALIITLLLVSSASFYENYKEGSISITDGLTSGGLLGILGLTVKKHFFNII
jgi:hypothetical protein